MFLIYLSLFPPPLLLLSYYLSVCAKNTLHPNIKSTHKHFLTAEQSNVQGTVFCVCPKITHSLFWKSKRISHSLSPSFSKTTRHLCLPHQASLGSGFVCLIWVHGHIHTPFLETVACLPQTWKSCPLVCHRRGFGRWWISLRLQVSLYLGRTPLVSLHLPLWRAPVRRLPSASTVFQELCVSFHTGLLCAWENSSWLHCLCSFPSWALSRANVSAVPQTKHLVRREGPPFSTTLLTNLPSICTHPLPSYLLQ